MSWKLLHDMAYVQRPHTKPHLDYLPWNMYNIVLCIFYLEALWDIFGRYMLLIYPYHSIFLQAGATTWLLQWWWHAWSNPGPLFTEKASYGYRNPHYKPKMDWCVFHVYNGNPLTHKAMSSKAQKTWIKYAATKQQQCFLHAKPWIPGDETAIFTAVIH